MADTFDLGGIAPPAPGALSRVDEEEEQLMRNFGEHRLMERVQATLKAQLEAQLLAAGEELRESEEAREAARAHREEVGVALYGVQQQLAGVQSALDARGNAIGALCARRANQEAQLAALTQAFALRRGAVNEAEAQLEAFRGELDGVLDTARLVERDMEGMSGEVAQHRRVTLKVAEALRDKEKGKAAQDAYIDTLTRAVRRAGEALASYNAQIDAQREQAARSGSTMAEAGVEMETIRLEKKQLMLQWQSTSLQLRKRDEALAAIAAALRESNVELEAMGAEEGNYRKAVAGLQAVHAKVADQLEREEADLRAAEESAAALRRQMDALEARRADVAANLEFTDGETKRANVEIARLQAEIKQLDNARAAVDRSRFGIEDEVNDALSSRLTQEKASRAMLKESAKLVERMHALDMEKAEGENALAGARVDALTAAARLAAMRDQLAGINREVAEKEALAAKAETEIRQRQDAIEKKASVLDRLNRKWERMREAAERAGAAGEEAAAAMGPLAGEVQGLTQALADLRENNELLQRRWLADHTALVTHSTETEVRATRTKELASELSLLQQKALRLARALDAEGSEKKRLEGAVKGIRDDMSRINALIAKNALLKEKLEVATYSSEKAFSDTLRDMEREAAAAEARTGALKEECARLAGDLVEAERQVLAWEKKIALEKETQDALDPTVGEGELGAMEKEVRRMGLRAEALKREQEKLVSEMERAVEKRDVIAGKHRSAKAAIMSAAAAAGKGLVASLGASTRGLSSVGAVASAARGKAMEGDALTRVGLERRAAELRAEVAAKGAALEEAEAALGAAREEEARVGEALAERTAALGALEGAVARARASLRATLFDKQRLGEWAAATERMLARFLALEAGKLPSAGSGPSESAAARARLREAEAVAAAVGGVCETLQAQHWDLRDAVAKVRELSFPPALVQLL
jgi:chromosome segregation ATPase